MKYIILILCALSVAHETHEACDQKVGITECLNTPVTATNIRTIQPNTSTLSMKHGPSNSEIASGTFRTLPNLEKLYLSFDDIQKLQPGCFQGLANLKQLHLTNNELQEIPNGVFDTCRRLKKLNLNLNKIITISNGVFNELVELEELDLSSNLLDHVPNVSNLRSLKILNLGYNKLTRIDEGSFSQLSRLNSLKLNDNLLTTIQNGAFRGLGNLNELDIRSNHLTNLNVRDIIQHDAENLHSIAISLNDFTCNNLNQIINQLTENDIDLTPGVSRAQNSIRGISCKN